MKKIKSIFIIAILLLLCFVLTGCQNKEYEDLKSKYESSQNQCRSLRNELNSTITKYSESVKQEKQEEINEKIKLLESKQKELETKKGELEKQKKDLENQIKTLQSDVIKIKGQPKTYPAGQLTAGTDIPTGKYKIYGGNSNFIVRSVYGDLKVNIILGGSYGVEEYIYTFQNGDKVEARSTFKLVEVK